MKRESGFTLLELLLAATLLAMMVGAVAGGIHELVSGFDTERAESTQARGLSAALARMERFGDTAQAVLYPALGDSSADSLVIQAGIDEDGDGKVNEDPPGDLSNDGRPGKKNKDDDGDGLVDEDLIGRTPGTPGYGGFVAGIGITALPNDDDEDGLQDEDPVNHMSWNWSSAGALTEILDGVSQPLATGVTRFVARHTLSADGRSMVRVRLYYGAAADTSAWLERVLMPANTSVAFGTRTDG